MVSHYGQQVLKMTKMEPGLVIDVPTLDGLDFNDDLNPGLLDDMNMYLRAYTTDDALRVGLADAGSGGPFGNGQGLKLSGQFANGLIL